jgi:hypothetical protein
MTARTAPGSPVMKTGRRSWTAPVGDSLMMTYRRT